VCFYATQLKDIPEGGITARFEGEFPDHDPHGGFKGALRCEVITGSWHKEGAAEKLPLYLSQESGTSGTLAHR
jgi:hypothetical protein